MSGLFCFCSGSPRILRSLREIAPWEKDYE